MFRRVGIPIIAFAGLLFSFYILYLQSIKTPVGPILFPSPESPYKETIVGQGLVESAYRNIKIAPPYADLVTAVCVAVGDTVQAGDILFKIDTRRLEAQLQQALERRALAEIEYHDKQKQFSFFENLCDKSAVSQQDYARAYYAMKLAWQAWQEASAAVDVIKTDIERCHVRAPIDGEILQLTARVGQYANVNPFDNQPIVLFGDTKYCHVRVDIDEEDAWRYQTAASATAYVRGNAHIIIPLEYVYSEPYVVPKSSLSGIDTQRVDTRVLQVIYRFDKSAYPVYVGQLLDVYIHAQPYGAVS